LVIFSERYVVGAEDTDTILSNSLKEFPRSKFTAEDLLSNGERLSQENGQLWDKFRAGNATLEDINQLRSDLDTATQSIYTKLSEPPIAKAKGKALADAMREFVQNQAPETQTFFKEMTTQFDIQKALALMENKSVTPGTFAKVAGHVAGLGAGGTVGGLIAGPTGIMLGGLAGDRAAGAVAKKLAGQNITQGILKRTGPNAIKVSRKEMLTKLPGLFGGAVNVK
jgi:hypothetical protein